MGFIDSQMSDYLMQDALGYNDNDSYPEYDDSFLSEKRQRPQTLGGVDYRKEKGGVLYDG